jgi:hypothetical protein
MKPVAGAGIQLQIHLSDEESGPPGEDNILAMVIDVRIGAGVRSFK